MSAGLALQLYERARYIYYARLSAEAAGFEYQTAPVDNRYVEPEIVEPEPEPDNRAITALKKRRSDEDLQALFDERVAELKASGRVKE